MCLSCTSQDRFVAREESWYCVNHFGGGQLVDASSGLDASYTVMSVSRFFPFGKPQSLPDLVEPPAFGTFHQSQVASLVKSVGACQCQPREAIHCCRSNQTRNQASFRLKRQRCPANASGGDGDTLPDSFIRNIIGFPSCTSVLPA